MGDSGENKHGTTEERIPPLRFYLILSFLLNTLFLMAAFLLMASARGVDQGFFLALIPIWIMSPMVGFLGWLIDRGSNGRNRSITLKMIGGVAGMFNGAVAGTSVGLALFGATGGTIGFIVFYILGILSGMQVGTAVAEKLARYMDFRF